MEGPTPVSALLHAATMVTAGVYLLLRISNFLLSAPNIMLLIAFWGALTAFFASSVGAFQNDIKKIIAYSTCSQLGYMVASCGLYNFGGSFFHLFNHAFFKAILFLGAGSVIHALLDEQDLRKYGFLINFLPFTYITMFVGSCSLIGFPFLSGFYSKDVLINWSFSDFSIISSFVYWLLTLSVFFTSFYSTKLLNLTFFSRNPRFSFSLLTSINESDFRFKTPLFFLAFFSIFSGFIFFDLFIGYGNDVLNIAISTENNNYFDLEYLNQFRKFVPLFFVFFGILTYFFSFHSFHKSFFCFFSYRDNEYFKSLIYLKNFFSKKWFFDFFYYKITIFFLNVGYILFKFFDKGIFEDIFVKKSIWFTYNFYKNLSKSNWFTYNFYKNYK